MSTNTNTTTKKATRPAGFTKAIWDNDTFRVYNGLIKLVKGEILAPQFVNHPTVKTLMEKCCGTKTPEDRWGLFLNLIVTMNTYSTVDHVKVNKIKSISTLRSWFNGGWEEKATRPVVYKEPKAPAKKAKKSAPKAKKSEVKKVTNASVSNWIKGMTTEQINKLKVMIADREVEEACAEMNVA